MVSSIRGSNTTKGVSRSAPTLEQWQFVAERYGNVVHSLRFGNVAHVLRNRNVGDVCCFDNVGDRNRFGNVAHQLQDRNVGGSSRFGNVADRKRFGNVCLRTSFAKFQCTCAQISDNGGSWSSGAGTKPSCGGGGCMRELVMVGLTCSEEMGVLTEVPVWYCGG